MDEQELAFALFYHIMGRSAKDTATKVPNESLFIEAFPTTFWPPERRAEIISFWDNIKQRDIMIKEIRLSWWENELEDYDLMCEKN